MNPIDWLKIGLENLLLKHNQAASEEYKALLEIDILEYHKAIIELENIFLKK